MQHAITDCDRYFEIDPVSRIITPLNQKTSIVQFDHNSERLTFSIPRYIEEHDMTECTNIEVHYSNIDANTKVENVGVYPITDMQVDPNDTERAICTWLISQNATQKVGILKFSIRFTCVDKDANILYSWNTGIFSSITVLASLYNSGKIAEEYADVLAGWKKEFDATIGTIAPYIGESGNWIVYNADAGKFVDTGTTAQGPQGDKGDVGDTLEFSRDTAKLHSLNNSSVATFSALNLYGESTQTMPEGVEQPTPDTPVDIVSVENPVVRVTGNNLFNIDVITDTASIINNGDGTLTANSYPSGTGKTLKELCPYVKVGDRLVFKFDTTSSVKYAYLSNGATLTSSPVTVTDVLLNAKISFYCNRVDGVCTPATISNIRAIFEGCPDVYETYTEPQEVVLNGITLRGLQSSKGLFKDEIVVDGKNKIVKHIQRVHYWNSLNHTGGWSSTGLNEDANIVRYSALICKPKWSAGGVALCTHFKYTTGGYTPNVYWEFTPGDASARAYFKVPLDQYPTPADFKAFMNANEVELICKLDEPIETDITNTDSGQALLALHTNYLDTNVASDAECAFSYTADLTTAYNQLLNRVATLEAAAVNNI